MGRSEKWRCLWVSAGRKGTNWAESVCIGTDSWVSAVRSWVAGPGSRSRRGVGAWMMGRSCGAVGFRRVFRGRGGSGGVLGPLGGQSEFHLGGSHGPGRGEGGCEGAPLRLACGGDVVAVPVGGNADASGRPARAAAAQGPVLDGALEGAVRTCRVGAGDGARARAAGGNVGQAEIVADDRGRDGLPDEGGRVGARRRVGRGRRGPIGGRRRVRRRAVVNRRRDGRVVRRGGRRGQWSLCRGQGRR